jgi:hypothetical protein
VLSKTSRALVVSRETTSYTYYYYYTMLNTGI